MADSKWAALGAGCIGFIAAGSLMGGEASKLKFLPPHSTVHGKTVAEWGARWWQWATFPPKGRNPVRDDRTGEFAHEGQSGPEQPDRASDECHMGESGPIFFLGGSFGGTDRRTVSVPAGKEILIPLFNYTEYNIPPESFSVPELVDQADDLIEQRDNLECTLDGEAIPEDQLLRHREPFQVFRMCLPTDNVFEEPPGEYFPAVNDGYYLVLEPPPPGTYEIQWKVVALNGTFRLDITVTLHIGGIAGFTRGEVNDDGTVNLADAVSILDWLFRSASAPRCRDAADIDDNGATNLTDAVYLLNHLFRGGHPPPAPGIAACGADPSVDELEQCASSCPP